MPSSWSTSSEPVLTRGPAPSSDPSAFLSSPSSLFGDSITVSLAFWAGLPHARKNLSPQAEAAYKLVSAHMTKECWRDWRGPTYGNEGRMTIRWAHDNVDAWLKKLQPETALIMFG